MEQKQSTMEQVEGNFTLVKMGESPAKAPLSQENYQSQPRQHEETNKMSQPEPSRDLSNEKMEHALPKDIHFQGPTSFVLQKCQGDSKPVFGATTEGFADSSRRPSVVPSHTQHPKSVSGASDTILEGGDRSARELDKMEIAKLQA